MKDNFVIRIFSVKIYTLRIEYWDTLGVGLLRKIISKYVLLKMIKKMKLFFHQK